MPAPTDWHDFAVTKLLKVLGEADGSRALKVALSEVGKERLETHDDLVNFASALSRRGGFAGAVGGLLAVHAAMHTP